ncbi:MAG: UvrD-helicase domain-containing protein [Planctomycetota bacterium]
MEALLEDLNEAQRAAVTHGNGPLLVVAGAGSGKTRVITRRIAWLVAHGTREGEVLGLTFTNKAAREMAERVEALLPGTWVRLSTFHSACARFLRRSGQRIGYDPDFSIKDVQDRNALIKQVMAELGIPVAQLKPSLVGNRISWLKNQGHRADDPALPRDDWLEEQVARIYPRYQEAMRAMNAMDFDDLLLEFLYVLEQHPDEREAWRRRFRHVLVDEFQDTNRIQYRMLKLLVGEDRNLCVVGDPDQSIYRFRGAEVGNILDFPEDFPDAKVVLLEENYRSTSTILELAQQVIAHNRLRHEKVLRPTLGPGEPVRVHRLETGREELALAVRHARRLVDEGVEPSSIAVFYRSRFLSRGLEEAFRRAGLPFQIVGDLSFYERKEIKDLVAFLQVLANPRDRLSLSRILNVPTRGIGKKSEELFFDQARRLGMAPVELLRSGKEVEGARGKARKGFKELGELLAEAEEPALVSVERTLKLFLERTGYLDWLADTGGRGDVDREENVKELLLHARHFDREAGDDPGSGIEDMGAVPLFLAQVSLASDRPRGEGRAEGVQLMTVHAAKGLEFDHVHVVGLEEGLFPHSLSLGTDAELEEERRLFYVAATRARRELVLSLATLRESYEGGWRANTASRFLDEAGLEAAPRDGRRAPGAAGRPFEVVDEPAWEEPVLRYDAPPGTGGDEERACADFHEGERVHHEAFGEGTVLRAFGEGPSAKVQVLFPSGVRTLLIEYAALQRVEEH